MSPRCSSDYHRHTPVCQCGSPVTHEDVVRTTHGAFFICSDCWDRWRRRGFDRKADRLAAVARHEAAS